MTFTLTLSNAGPSPATGVTVTNSLPGGIVYVSSNPSAGSYSPATGLWTVGSLANGSNATLQLTGTVTSAGTKTSLAQVTAAQPADPDSTPNNGNPAEDDQASVTVTPKAADLALTHTVNKARPNVRENITFTVGLANLGPSEATNVTVRDLLPPGLTFVGAAASQGTYAPSTGLWNVGKVVAGGSASLQLTATVTTGRPEDQHRRSDRLQPARSRLDPQQQQPRRGRPGQRVHRAVGGRSVADQDDGHHPAQRGRQHDVHDHGLQRRAGSRPAISR